MTIKSFADLKKNRNKDAAKLSAEFQKINQQKTFADTDEDIWYPALDKTGNTEAIIRFLPAPLGEELPVNKLMKISFKGPTGKWYIENCLKTIGQEDPVLEYNNLLWNKKTEDAANQARAQKAKVYYTANVYIIKDKVNPEFEGKVKKFRFGKKIFDKINELMFPAFEGEDAINPFDLWNGATFRLRIKMGDNGFRNYDSSKFDNPSPLFDDDDKIELVWKQCHSLLADLAPDKYKSYDELKAKMLRVLDLDTSVTNKPSTVNVGKSSKPALEEETDDDGSDDDDELNALKALMADD